MTLILVGNRRTEATSTNSECATSYNYRFEDYTKLWSSLSALPTKKLKTLKEVSLMIIDAFATDFKAQKKLWKETSPPSIELEKLVSRLERITSWITLEIVAVLCCKEESNAFGFFYNWKELSVDEVELQMAVTTNQFY